MLRRLSWRNFDFVLLGLVAVLTMFGVAMIRSAIAGNETLAQLPSRQALYAGVGFVLLFILAVVDYHIWLDMSRVFYIVVVLALIALNIAGTALFGSSRWFRVGPIFLQPSEFAKVVLILVQARFLARRGEAINRPRVLATSALITGFLWIWVFLQPDLSTSVTLGVIWVAMLWAAGLRFRYFLGFGLAGVISAIVGFPLLRPYQQQRVIQFLFPDPEARYGEIYNVQQALIAIGSGGLFGKGYGQGPQVQLRFLKVRHTDFIFAVIAHELGFVGALVVLLLLLGVIWRCVHVARRAYDTEGALIAYGVAAMLSFHTLVNVAMNLNLMPVTGLPLPFITYGGSVLLASLIAIGLVESVALHRKPVEF